MKLADNFYIQNPGEPLLGLLDSPKNAQPASPDTRSYRLLHIVNTYRSQHDSKESQVQRYTYTTMRTAREFTGKRHTVDFVSVQFPEDRDQVPDMFLRAEDLQRSVLDCGNFRVPRRLPLIFDILKNGIAAGQDSDFVIFTNTDINLMPYFYDCIARILDCGFDAIVVNRREIPGYSLDPTLLPLMYADYGVIHQGFDCFVFPARLYRRFVINEACVGAGLVMRGLLYNLVAHARTLLLRDCHLTFHLGQDRAWQAAELADYTEHNRANGALVLAELTTNPAKRELLKPFLKSSRQVPDRD